MTAISRDHVAACIHDIMPWALQKLSSFAKKRHELISRVVSDFVSLDVEKFGGAAWT